MGKNRAVPAGTVMLRVAVPEKMVPARNHTLPDCPTAALAPVSSISGLDAAGMAMIHSSHRAVSCAYPPYALLWAGI